MTHKHIGVEDWQVIALMLNAGFIGSEIARTIGKDTSAVNRHIDQNGGRDDYDVPEVCRKKYHKRIAAMENNRVLKGVLLRRVGHSLRSTIHQSR
jgi:IS30 family transposase